MDSVERKTMMNPDPRRTHQRNPFHCFARFRAPDAGPGDFERLCVTKDFSHDGIYFVALDESVREKMRLLLRFPYLADSDAVQRNCIVEVVRTRTISQGRCGVGARLISNRVPAMAESGLILSELARSNVAEIYRINLEA
jgi:hypothetical protein